MSRADSAAGRAPVGWDIGHLRWGLAVTAVLAVLGGLLGWALAGPRAAAWVVAGQALVAAFFAVGTLAVAWAGRVADELTLPVALVSYVVKIALLGLFMVSVRDADWLDPAAFGWSVLVGTLGWTAAHVRRVWTTRIYYVDPR